MNNYPRLIAAGVKKAARDFGADIVGIGGISRWDSVLVEHHPRSIMPSAFELAWHTWIRRIAWS